MLLLLIGSSLETRGYDAGEDQKLLERKEKNMQEKSKGYHCLLASAFAFSLVIWGIPGCCKSSSFAQGVFGPKVDVSPFSEMTPNLLSCFHERQAHQMASQSRSRRPPASISCGDVHWNCSLFSFLHGQGQAWTSQVGGSVGDGATTFCNQHSKGWFK